MSEQLPAPEFDAQNYARPNEDWICGHAGDGLACRQGPDARGHCRAIAECKPVLETKPGESKGRWRCTRPGGECESGPRPDGSCGRPIAKCAPVPSLRQWRGRMTLAVIAAAGAALLLVLGNPPWRNRIISPGIVSDPHSSAAFAALAMTNHLNPGCGACHRAGNAGPAGLVNAARHAEPGIFDLKKLADAKPAQPAAIDESCLKCHAGRNVHQPLAPALSCSFCHAEHQGPVPAAPTGANCIFCHGDAAKLGAKAEGGRRKAETNPLPVIHHFAGDHPQFRFLAEKWRDPDTLKFNHALHLTGATIPKLPGGGKLDCAFCHSPDVAGAFMKPAAFENNCRVCHSLQFDPETPQLQLPHGSVEFVSAFLRSLPKPYLALAAKEHPADANGFAGQKLAALRAQFGNGEELERRVFFSTATSGPAVRIGTVSGATRPMFPGCAYCHEVKPAADGAPQLTKPLPTERWLTRGKFNHARHVNLACAQCHDASHSKDTADVLLPPKETCAACHSPRGGVADSCATCHVYHKTGIVTR